MPFNFQTLLTMNLSDPKLDIGPIFREADMDGDGKVTINDAVQFFKPSNVNSATLKQIWDRSVSPNGFLDYTRFLYALKLLQLAMRNNNNAGSNSPQLSPGQAPLSAAANINAAMYAAPMPSPRPFAMTSTPPLTPNAPLAGNIPDITDAEREKHAETFVRIGGNSTGFLGGDIAVPVFMKSNVPVLELQKIWKLADLTGDNRLDADEFVIAMHLITLKMRYSDSFALPDSLPERYVASVKRMSAMYQPTISPMSGSPVPMTPPMAPEPVSKAPVMRSDSILSTMTQSLNPAANNKELAQLNETAAEKRKTENELMMQISKQTASIDALKSQVQERQQYIAERESSIAQKQLQLDELRRQEEELQRVMQEQNVKLEAATRDRKSYETQIAQLKARMEIQSREYEQCTTQLRKLEQERQRLVDLSQTGSLKLEEMDRDVVTLRGQIQAQEQEYAAQKAAITQLRDSFNSNTQQKEVLQQQNAQLKQQLIDTRAEIAEYRKKNDDLITEIDGFETSRVEYESATKDTAAKLAELVRERNELNERFSRLQDELVVREKLYASNSKDSAFLQRLQLLAHQTRKQLDLFNSSLTEQIGDMDTQVTGLAATSGSVSSRSRSSSGRFSRGNQDFGEKEFEFLPEIHTDMASVGSAEPASDAAHETAFSFDQQDDFGKQPATVTPPPLPLPTTTTTASYNTDTSADATQAVPTTTQTASDPSFAAFDDNDNFGKFDTTEPAAATTFPAPITDTTNTFADDWGQPAVHQAEVASGFNSNPNWGYTPPANDGDAAHHQHVEATTEFSDNGFDVGEGFGTYDAPPEDHPKTTGHSAPVRTSGFDDFDSFGSGFGQGFDEAEFSKGFEDADFGFGSTAKTTTSGSNTSDNWASF